MTSSSFPADDSSKRPATRGNEASCRVIVGMVELAAAGGIATERILEGLGHPPEHLMDPKNRTDYETALEILMRLRREAGSLEAFVNLAERYGSTPAYGYFKWIAGLLFSPIHMFTYPNAVVLRLNFGPAWRYTWKRLDSRRVRFTYATTEGYEGTTDLWEFTRVTMAKLPGLLGLPDALVQIESISRDSATYLATMPPSGTISARAGRFFRMHGASPDPAFAMFAHQHEELRRSYEILNATERARADLVREMLRVADREREHFAREIHDGLGQELVAVRYQIESLAREFDGPSGTRVGQLAELVSKSNELARSLARSYDPMVGSHGDFAEAARKLSAQYGGRICFELSGLEAVRLAPGSALHLYRVAQEAVSNAVRHGNAHRIRLAARVAAGTMDLAIEDDGPGLPSGHQVGMGLRTMRYRLEELGGTLSLEPSSLGGLCVRCSVPAARAANEASSPRGGVAA